MKTNLKTRLLSAVMALMLAMSLLGGCTGSGTQTPSDAPSASAASSETPAPAFEAPASEIPEASLAETAAPSETPEAAPEVSHPSDIFPLEETYTFTVWDVFPPPLAGFMEGPYDCVAIQELEKLTNVDLEYSVNSTETASELFNLMCASGDYCDFIYGVGQYYTGGPDKAMEDEVIIDLTDIAKDIPNLQAAFAAQPDALELTPNGKMYNFPVVAEKVFNSAVAGISTRGDWLEKAGLSAPVTYDDYYNMLSAFKTEFGSAGPQLIDASGFASVFGDCLDASTGFYQVDGQIVYGPTQPGYKAYLEMMNRWYTEGLIYKDFYSLVGPPSDLIADGTVAAWAGDAGTISFFTGGITDEGYYISALKSPVEQSGDTSHFGVTDPSVWTEGWAVSTDCDDYDMVKAFMDFCYGDDFSFICNYGVEGESYTRDGEGNIQFTDNVLHNPDTILRFALWKYTLFGYVPHKEDQTRDKITYTDEQLSFMDTWAAVSDEAWALPDDFELSADDTSEAALIMSDIETYLEEATLGFITGAKPLNEFDAFVSDIESMNLQGAVDIYQRTLEKYE